MKTATQAELIARIAEETRAPLEEVTQTYLDAWRDLSVDARIQDYLPLLVAKRVTAQLRERRSS
jgi:hypothetical protein